MSLRLRLTVLNSLILLLVGGVLVAAVYAILVQGLQRQIDDSLREQARLYGADVSAWFYRETRRLPGPQFGPGTTRTQVGSPGAPPGPGGPVIVNQAGGPGAPGGAGVVGGPVTAAGAAGQPGQTGSNGPPGPNGQPGPVGPGGPGSFDAPGVPGGNGAPSGPGLGPPAPGGVPPEVGALGPPELVVPIFRRFAGTSTFVQVANGSGQVEARSENLGADTLPLPPDALGAALDGDEWLGEVAVEGQRLRAIVTPLRVSRVPGEPPVSLVLQVAQPLGSLEETLVALQTTVLLVGAGGVLIAVIAGWVLARTALHPIERFAQTADAIGAARDFGQRVPVPSHRPDEIGRLGMAFNRMLDELQEAHEHVATALVAQRRFVADASHELRTPLATMRGNVDLLRQMIADLGGGTSQETAILDDVSLEAERMSRLVADLLLLAQADAGQHLRLRTIDVSRVAGDAARTARLLRDDVLVEATALPGDLWVRGHADRLRQVMMILLDNAVKHSPPGGRVSLAAERAVRDGRGWVTIRVADEGLGIPTPEQARIFERFYRAPGSRSGEGTGLGLAIGRWIVEEHQGSIELASEPGQGAMFTVWLPADAAPEDAAADLPSPGALSAVTASVNAAVAGGTPAVVAAGASAVGDSLEAAASGAAAGDPVEGAVAEPVPAAELVSSRADGGPA